MALTSAEIDALVGPTRAESQTDRTSIYRALERNPQDVADATRISREVGLPSPVVLDNIEQARTDSKARAVELALGAAPELGDLTRDDNFITAIKDEPEQIGVFRQLGQNIGAAVKRSMGGLLVTQGALGESLGNALGQLEGPDAAPLTPAQQQLRAQINAQRRAKGLPPVEEQNVLNEGVRMLAEADAENKPLMPWEDVTSADGVMGKAVSGLLFAGETTITSIPEMFASALAPVAVGASYAGQVGAERSQRRGAARPELSDVAAAAPAAAIMALLNKYGADRVLGFSDMLASTAARRIGTAAAAEGATEVAQEEIQYIAERLGIDPLDAVEMRDLILPTLVGGAGAGGLIRTGTEAISAGAAKLVKQSAQDADERKKLVDQLASLSEAAALRETMPEGFNRMVEQLAPGVELYVDATDAETLLQRELPPEIIERVEEAVEASTPVRFTAAEYATYLAPFGQQLNDRIRVGSATAMNSEEAQTIETEFAARAEEAIKSADAVDAVRAEAEQIRSQVQAQIVSSGRFRNDVADAYAALVRDFYTATAARAGMTPAQMWARYPLRVRSNKPAKPGDLKQLPLDEIKLKDEGADGFYLEADGGHAALLRVRRHGNAFRIRGAEVARKGEGTGQQLLTLAYQEAKRRGLALQSDSIVSAEQLRAYDALRRKGWVIEYSDPARVADAIAGKRKTITEDKDRPVVTRIEPPTALQQSAVFDERALSPVASLAADADEVPQGFTRFRHFGRFAVPTLDPAFEGTGLKGAESRRPDQNRPNVISLYPDDIAAQGGPERGVGPIEYVVDVPTAQLYDLDADPQGFRERGLNTRDAQGFPVQGVNWSAVERELEGASFAGYTTQGQARLFRQVGVRGGKRDPASKIPRADELPAEMREIETRFADWIANNFDAAVAQYEKLPESMGGRVMNTDIARELSPDYRNNRGLSAAVHEPASWFIQQLYARKLKEAPEGNVLFTAGGTGAGKSTALRGRDLSQWPIIYDTNIAKASSGQKKIDQALEAGRKVDVYYVYADPLDAFRRAISRTQHMAAKLGTGRTVPVWAHVGSHVGSRQAVPELQEHYEDDADRVSFTIMFNETGTGSRETDVASLPSPSYDSVREVIEGELEDQYQKGQVSQAEYEAFRSEGATESRSGEVAGRQVGPREQELQGTVLNIGLAVTDGEAQTPEALASLLNAAGFGVQEMSVVPANPNDEFGPFEDTLVVRLDRKPTPEEMQMLLVATQQAAIPISDNGAGEMHVQPSRMEEAQREGWAEFNPQFFNRFDGTKLAALQQESRGEITFGRDFAANPTVITLFEKADLSTFLHESGHFFLEVLTDLAAREGAPAEIVNDAQVLFNWMGFKGTAADWRAASISSRENAHEQFARGFEAYLFEGKAPSQELRTLFHRFRAWLLNVYKSMARLNVNLTDEVRQVMDRMIASRDQVAAAEQARQLLPLFKDAAAAGMDEATWRQYQQLAQDATNNAQDQLQTRSLRNLRWLANARAKELAKMQKANESKRAAVRDAVENLIAQRPERIAETLLLTGEAWRRDAEGQLEQIKLPKPHKLSTERLAALYGTTDDYRAVAADAGMVDASATRAPWHALPRNLVAKEGLDPDTVAEMVGFTSGDELVQALLRMQPREQLVEKLTDQAVLRRYGDLNDTAQIERAVDIALHNQMRTRMVATELAALEGGQAIGTRRDALRRAAREFAERVVQGKRVRDLRPGQFAAGEAKAARMALEAMAAGSSAEAAAHKRDQLFNGYASRAASRAQDRIEVALRYLQKFSETGTRKNLEPGYRDQIDKLLERYSLKPATLRQIDKRAALSKWIDEQRAQGHEPAIPDELLDEARRTHYRNMTVEEFEGLVDAVKNIEHLARLKNKLLANKRQRDFEKARDELVTSIVANAPKAKPVEMERDASLLGRAADLMRDWFTSLRKLSSFARQMDGGADGGMAWEYFVRALNDAGDSETRMRAEATRKLDKLFDKVPGMNPNAIERGARALTGDRKLYIPEIGKSLSLQARIAVALNAGNAGNKQRLVDGNKWTEGQIQAIINTLSKDEMDFAQGVLDMIDSYWSQIKAKEERVSGVAPGRVDATPIRTPHGEYRGGYYPIVADPMRSDKAATQNDAELIAQSLRGAVGRATTRRGHTKARVGGQDPVRLDLGVIVQHVAQVTHDLAWHETLIDFNKMLRDPQVSTAIREHYGPEVTAFMRRVADDVARGEVGPRGAAERMLNHMRVGSTVVGLGLSATTALLQFTGVTQSIVRTGTGTVARGYALWLANPVESTQKVYEKSTFMQQRDQERNRELGEIFNRLDGKKHSLAKVYFWPIQVLQKGVDIPTWLGVYNKALSAGEADERAVALADQAVADAQSSGRVHDLSEIQRGGPVLKLLTNFYSYFSATYQLATESAQRVGREKSVASVLNLGMDYLMLFSVPVVLGTLIREGLRGDLPDDEEELAAKLAIEQVAYVLGMFPIIREVSGSLQGFSYQGPAGLSMLSDFSKMAQQAAQGEADEAFWRSLNRTAGTLLHYPAGQLDRSVRGAIAVSEGDAPPQAILVGPPRE